MHRVACRVKAPKRRGGFLCQMGGSLEKSKTKSTLSAAESGEP